MEEAIETMKALLKKASETESSGEALHYSQAALNAAHAAATMKNIQQQEG